MPNDRNDARAPGDDSEADARPLLLLLDGSHALFRAHFAIRNLTAPDGTASGALYGYTSTLMRLLATWNPAAALVCFDATAGGFRRDIDPNYKANRPPTPPDLSAQWPHALEVTRELGVCALDDTRLEADDLIATYATHALEEGYNVVIVSGDKDLMQLVVDEAPAGGRARQLVPGKDLLYDEAAVEEKWGVPPELIGDLLAIMGDKVDNIPGVRGIGVKGAVGLLRRWGSLDAIYANVQDSGSPRTQRLLVEGEPSARLSRQLVELVRDAPLPASLTALAPEPPQRDILYARFERFGFRRLMTVFAPEQAREVFADDRT